MEPIFWGFCQDINLIYGSRRFLGRDSKFSRLTALFLLAPEVVTLVRLPVAGCEFFPFLQALVYHQ